MRKSIASRDVTAQQSTFVVGSDEYQNVVVSQHDRLIDFCFAEPRSLFAGRENLDGHVLAAPATTPHLPPKHTK